MKPDELLHQLEKLETDHSIIRSDLDQALAALREAARYIKRVNPGSKWNETDRNQIVADVDALLAKHAQREVAK